MPNHCIMESYSLGVLKHNGRFLVYLASDRFVLDASTKIGKNDDFFAATSDSTGSMSEFGKLLEEMGTFHSCCSDNEIHLNSKKL